MVKKIAAMIVQSHTRSDRLSMRGPGGYGESMRTVLQDCDWEHGDAVTIMKTSDINPILQDARYCAEWYMEPQNRDKYEKAMAAAQRILDATKGIGD
jgi:hypothetical protein